MPRRLRQPAQQYSARIQVALAGVLDGTDDGPKWVQVTREGDFPGYLGGLKPFSFTRKDLEDMVANVKAHPSYLASADGVATGEVVPWDFNHASEANPTSGDLPVVGAPSRAWTLDMEVRDGADGTAELWALTQFLEPARTYVKTGQYLWASVAVAFNAVSPVTGQNVGALVTSIALTNTPFVEGMQRLVASKNGIPGGLPVAGQTELRRTWYEAARDPSDAISMMREMFALPETAGAAEVMAQVAVVQQWAESGTAPLGTNPEELISNMRTILNLPALTPQASVLDEAGKSIQALLEEQAAAAGVPGVPTQIDDGMVPDPQLVMAAERQKEEVLMDELIKILAAALGVRENETSITTAVTELAQLRDSLKLAFGLSRDGTSVILEAAKEGVDAKERLLALFAALEVADPEAALAKITSTLAAAKSLEEVMPELKDLKADKAATEKAAVEVDVDEAIAASKLNPSLKGALLLQRTSDPEGFAKAFPKGAPQVGDKKHLLTAVTTRGASPLVSDGTGVQLAQPGAAPSGDVINLSNYPGRNSTARAKTYLSGQVANWADLSNEEQFERAVALKRQSNVICA